LTSALGSTPANVQPSLARISDEVADRGAQVAPESCVGERDTKQWPGSELEITAGVGHMVQHSASDRAALLVHRCIESICVVPE
jgi:pimeloyl-ACP methyl ester carboxylesterase